MAELAAMTRAARVANALQLQAAIFHTDCKEAVLQLQKGRRFLFWRLRPLLSHFSSLLDCCSFEVVKICRQENWFAHCLAMQARAVLNHGSIVFSCTSHHRPSLCAVLTALQNVTWDQFDLIYVTMFLTNKVSCY